MATKKCPLCAEEIQEEAIICKHCRRDISDPSLKALSEKRNAFPKKVNNFNTAEIKSSDAIIIKPHRFRCLFWFALANAGIVATVSVVSAGTLVGIVPFLLAYACLFPFIALFFSKNLAMKSHNMRIINPGSADPWEESIYHMVESLAKKAGLETPPDVGIYESDDINAFATGASRNNSLVAFSIALLEEMDRDTVAAVAAHEIGHIASGDMVTMTLVQSVVNSVVLLVTVPMSALKILSFFSDEFDWLAYWIISAAKFLATLALAFLGSLVANVFSRRREFAADEIAARLTSRDSMIHCLRILGGQTVSFPKEQASYAALKICAPRHWLDIFSTHPSIERRIQALERIYREQ